ncbi:Calcium-binding EF hand family protein [Trifolium repens]|nr:Calcium-binding EF hand family protein [Trifolium repens]
MGRTIHRHLHTLRLPSPTRLADEYDDKFNRLVRLPSRIYSVEPSGSNSDEDGFSRRIRFIIRICFSHFASNSDSDGDSFGYGMSWWKEEHFNASDVDATQMVF